MYFANYEICIVTLAKMTVRIIERIDLSPPSDLQMSFRLFFLSFFLQLGIVSRDYPIWQIIQLLPLYCYAKNMCGTVSIFFCVVKIVTVNCQSSSPFPGRYVLSVCHWYRCCVSSFLFPGRCVLSLCTCTVCLLPLFQVDVCWHCVSDTGLCVFFPLPR